MSERRVTRRPNGSANAAFADVTGAFGDRTLTVNEHRISDGCTVVTSARATDPKSSGACMVREGSLASRLFSIASGLQRVV